MLNLTQHMRQEGELSWWSLYRSFRDPDFYLAENVADLKENAPQLTCPWYKRDYFLGQHCYRAHLVIRNVGLRSLYSMGEEGSRRRFLVHDGSGEVIANWIDELGPNRTFEEVSEEEGLVDDDWVHGIYFVFLIEQRALLIANVYKVPAARTKREVAAKEHSRAAIPILAPA